MKLPFEIDLSGKTAVVTGAGGVLCSMFAEALAKAGARVALLDLNKEAAEGFAKKIRNDGGTAKGYVCNVLDKDTIQQARDEINKDFGTCDILVNGAGGNNPKATTDDEYYSPEDVGKMKTFFDLDKSGIEFVFNLNFLGTLLPTQVFAADMTEKDDACIINISSMNAYTPLTKIPAYSGAKAAVSNLTQWLAVHFSRTNIRCNAIAPGFIETPWHSARTQESYDRINRKIALHRFGTVEEVADMAYAVLSNGYMNGSVVDIHGGYDYF